MRRILIRAAWWLATAGVVAAIGGIAVAQQLPQLKGSLLGSWAQAQPAPCLPGMAIPIMASPHLSVAALQHVRYNSSPPTSGPHFAIPPAPGIYDSPLPPSEFVHAEEHGHIVIVYPLHAARTEVDALKKIAKADPEDVVLTPYPQIHHGIALAAWGRLERLPQVDRAVMTRFITALAGRYDHKWMRADPCGSRRSARAGGSV
jgi:hypothetical protein